MAVNPIKVDISPEKRDALLLETLWVIKNLRDKKIIWEKHYGSYTRENLRIWESRADRLLESLNIPIESAE